VRSSKSTLTGGPVTGDEEVTGVGVLVQGGGAARRVGHQPSGLGGVERWAGHGSRFEPATHGVETRGEEVGEAVPGGGAVGSAEAGAVELGGVGGAVDVTEVGGERHQVGRCGGTTRHELKGEVLPARLDQRRQSQRSG
jgi:hypothetical protein